MKTKIIFALYACLVVNLWSQVPRSIDSLTVGTKLVLPAKADPGTPTALELWISTTTADTVKYRSGGATFSLLTTAGGAALVSDTAYDATSWNGVTAIAPSKNAVRDIVELLQPLDASLTALAGGSDFVSFTGPTTSTKIFTLPDASATLLYAGGDAGTPSALVGTNITGTAAGLTAGTVTTNANLTGHVTSSGNATVLGSFTAAQLNTAISDADFQPLDTTLTSLAGVTTAADKLIYATGVDVFATADLTSYARTLLDDTTAAAARGTLGYATSTTDNAIARFDSTAGATQDSAVTISDVASTNVTVSATTGNSLTLATLDSNANVIITPHGTGLIRADASIYVPTATSSIGLGTAPDPAAGLLVYGTRGTGLPSFYAIDIETTADSSVTTGHQGIFIALNTAAAAFTLTNQWGIRIVDGTKGAGSTITNQTAFFSGNMTRGANNYGFVGQVAAAATSWNLYMSGTAANYLAGELLIGSTTDAGAYALQVTGAAIFSSTVTTLGGATFHTTSSALTDGAGAAVATFTNAPVAGNPTKWIGLNDNGTTRYIPAF